MNVRLRPRNPVRTARQGHKKDPCGGSALEKPLGLFCGPRSGPVGMDAGGTLRIQDDRGRDRLRANGRPSRVQSLPDKVAVLCPPGTQPFRGPFFCAMVGREPLRWAASDATIAAGKSSTTTASLRAGRLRQRIMDQARARMPQRAQSVSMQSARDRRHSVPTGHESGNLTGRASAIRSRPK